MIFDRQNIFDNQDQHLRAIQFFPLKGEGGGKERTRVATRSGFLFFLLVPNVFLLFSYCFLIENIWFSIWLTKWQLSIRARIRIWVFNNYAASGALGARARSEWRLGNKKP